MQWTVGKKLAGGFGLALFLLLLIGGVSYWSVNSLIENSSWVAHTHEVLENLEGIISLLKDAETGQRGFLLTRKDSYLDPYHLAQEKLNLRVKEVRRLTSDNLKQQRRLDVLEPKIQALLQELKKVIQLRMQDEAKDAVSLEDLQKAKGLEAALKIIMTNDRGKNLMDELRRDIQEMEAEEKDLLAIRVDQEKASVGATKWTIILGSLVAIVSLSVIGFLITRGLTGPLRQLGEMSQKITAGNLKQEKVRITSRDEIGQLGETFNGMLVSLQELSRQTIMVTESLNTATAEIMASVQEQASSTKEQAVTVQQITTTMEEVGQSGAQISSRAKQVAAAAEATSTATTSGTQAVQETNRTMLAIRAQVEEVAENIVALSEKTQAIGEIIATVNDIAERSNLLALNAAIEAAAVGEQGNRFSVVANEMKNLADQAKDSTVQVRTILGDIQKGINSSVMLTEEGVKRVETGKQQADVTEQTIRQMTKTTLDSVQAFEQIIGAGNQQQIGFEQVAQGMKDIRQAAGQTAAATSQLEKAVANLNGLSRELRQTVGRYQV